ncbi:MULTISPECIES: VOC family protein [Streptomyces]|uniref:VOC family protein n=1 Tax=Streptomyces tendae TaxID=1932 RepID=A0ABW7S3W3_STRTE|nr:MULTISPECIES: VOC family protein [unclassified Streptomyces]MBQ0963206.1 VOC family protein [Streptomyces sp. RK74B]MBQ1002903.1 VOC family protein [Streptomyces sp. RK23]BET52494.1 VOC family protein [Kitasatospora aureofaciens]
MTARAVTHLNFRGDAREALTFYRSAFGGDLTLVTYKDAGTVQDPDAADQVMFGQVATADGLCVMAYDVPSDLPWNQGENAFFVSVRGESSDEITAYWQKLAEGATVLRPLGAAQWAPLYGMLRDRFGVTWVLDVVSEYRA